MNTNNYLNSIVSLFLIFTTCAFTAPVLADNVVQVVAPLGFTTGKSRPAKFYLDTAPGVAIGSTGNLSYSALLIQAEGMILPSTTTLTVDYQYDSTTAQQEIWRIYLNDTTATGNRVAVMFMWSNKPNGFSNPSDSASVSFGNGTSCTATASEQIAVLAKALLNRKPVTASIGGPIWIYDKNQNTMVELPYACMSVAMTN